jgi:cell division protease FtsH
LLLAEQRQVPACEQLVERTEGVSAAFIKEVARRLAQQSISAGHSGQVDAGDLESVLEEMLSERDGLNLRLLGGEVSAIAQRG